MKTSVDSMKKILEKLVMDLVTTDGEVQVSYGIWYKISVHS